MEEQKDYLTTEDIARRLGISEDTVRNWIRTKQLKAYRVGHYRVLKTDFDEFLRKRATIEDDGDNREGEK